MIGGVMAQSGGEFIHPHGHHHDHYKVLNHSVALLFEGREKESFFSIPEERTKLIAMIKPELEIHTDVYDIYIRTTLYSYIAFTISYLVLRMIIVPSLLKLLGKSYVEYFQKSVTPYEKAHHSQVALSFAHAIIATVGSYYCTIHIYGMDLLNFALQNAYNQPFDLEIFKTRHWFLAITLGYFIADLTFYFFNHFHPFSPNDQNSLSHVLGVMIKQAFSLDLLHHYISCLAYVYFFSINVGSFLIISFEINEISTPFLHVRYYARQWEQTSKWWYHLNQACFVVTFFVSRILYNGVLMYFVFWSQFHRSVLFPVLQVDSTALISSFVFPILYYGVQCLWWIAISKIIIGKITGAKQKEE
ncbi:predicted protein [Naegleria gruberi]|uniref:Predicted protein n=1 Tax=Naegleria gruberi TaxID=5762 RepID=D2V320_NAEGR|nr:uncharacterized protein NAEGRDRAFT_63197 [Naegleria gruberi]EFC48553.1 predicted protein [Naegleria gruberi]|eukprot:XP_002681297.1 predicted protein [Naegleria gruberi strain NEG-M]